jgi:hypothetical protein
VNIPGLTGELGLKGLIFGIGYTLGHFKPLGFSKQYKEQGRVGYTWESVYCTTSTARASSYLSIDYYHF